jgi:hypothetical protein
MQLNSFFKLPKPQPRFRLHLTATVHNIKDRELFIQLIFKAFLMSQSLILGRPQSNVAYTTSIVVVETLEFWIRSNSILQNRLIKV